MWGLPGERRFEARSGALGSSGASRMKPSHAVGKLCREDEDYSKRVWVASGECWLAEVVEFRWFVRNIYKVLGSLCLTGNESWVEGLIGRQPPMRICVIE